MLVVGKQGSLDDDKKKVNDKKKQTLEENSQAYRKF